MVNLLFLPVFVFLVSAEFYSYQLLGIGFSWMLFLLLTVFGYWFQLIVILSSFWLLVSAECYSYSYQFLVIGFSWMLFLPVFGYWFVLNIILTLTSFGYCFQPNVILTSAGRSEAETPSSLMLRTVWVNSSKCQSINHTNTWKCTLGRFERLACWDVGEKTEICQIKQLLRRKLI